MGEELEGGLVDKIRSGLAATNPKWTVLVHLFNLAVLLILYIYYRTLTAWLHAENDFLTLLPFSVLILLGIEYVVTTFLKERREKKWTSFQRPAVWDNHSAKRAACARAEPHLNHSYALPVKIAISLAVPMVVGVWVFAFIDRNHVAIDADGTTTISISVDEARIEPSVESVWAVIKTTKKQFYCVAPVTTLGSSWSVSIINKEFLKLDDSWQIDYYTNAKNEISPYSIVTYPPILGDRSVTCTASRIPLKVRNILYLRPRH